MRSSFRARSQAAIDAICLTDQDKALRQLDQLLHESPSDLLGLYFRAIIWSAKQEWAKALSDYELACMLSPDDPSLRFDAGLVAWHAGDLEKAERFFSDARRLDPACEGSHYYLALTYERQNRISEALSLAHKALELRPTGCSIGVDHFIGLIDKLEQQEDLARRAP